MNPIETREFRGITIRGMWWLISSTALIVAAVMLQYFKILSEIQKVRDQRATDFELLIEKKNSNERISEYRLQAIERQLGAFSVQIENLRNEVSENSKRLNGDNDRK